MRVEGPMVLDKFSNFSRRSVEQPCVLKSNLLGDGAVLPQQQNRTRCAVSNVSPAREIQTDFQRVPAVPGFVRKLKRRPNLTLVGIPVPRIEEIAAPTVRGNQHVLGSLTVGVTVKSGVANDRV